MLKTNCSSGCSAERENGKKKKKKTQFIKMNQINHKQPRQQNHQILLHCTKTRDIYTATRTGRFIIFQPTDIVSGKNPIMASAIFQHFFSPPLSKCISSRAAVYNSSLAV